MAEPTARLTQAARDRIYAISLGKNGVIQPSLQVSQADQQLDRRVMRRRATKR
jgi:hypothetical protein